MKLRTQLLLFVSSAVFFSASAAALGFGLMEDRFLRAESAKRATLIEESAKKAAGEALLLDDPLAAVSYFRFFKSQWPPLNHVRLEWNEGGRKRDITVGDPRAGAELRRAALEDPKGRGEARLEIGLDPESLGRDLEQARRRLAREAAVVLAALLAAGSGLAYLWAVRLVRPLALLSEGADAVGAGRLDVRLEHASDDELGRLVAAFNRMSSRLAELDQMKKDFVSGVTHELRSPVAAVQSLLNVLLSRPGLDPSSLEYLGRARTNLQRLEAFIDNLLDAAKIERGRLELKPEPQRLAPAVGEVLGLFEARAAERGVLLGSGDLGGLTVRADGDALRRVLVNLISNALKFTPSGGRISVAARPSGAVVEIDVADTGQGIPADELPKLFDRFARGSSAARTPGTGLGLYLVKQTVEAHGGKVGVRSAPGEGTTFTLLWPAS
jgi:two-component system sensor histidine kinase BaeS